MSFVAILLSMIAGVVTTIFALLYSIKRGLDEAEKMLEGQYQRYCFFFDFYKINFDDIHFGNSQSIKLIENK